MKKCPDCGFENPNDSRFCVKCGAKFSDMELEKNARLLDRDCSRYDPYSDFFTVIKRKEFDYENMC